jgi:hypothetical protein
MPVANSVIAIMAGEVSSVLDYHKNCFKEFIYLQPTFDNTSPANIMNRQILIDNVTKPRRNMQVKATFSLVGKCFSVFNIGNGKAITEGLITFSTIYSRTRHQMDLQSNSDVIFIGEKI